MEAQREVKCFPEEDWIKNPSWTWKNDLKYYLIMPINVIKMTLLYLRPKDSFDHAFGPSDPGVSLWDAIGLAQAEADIQCGRWFRLRQDVQVLERLS